MNEHPKGYHNEVKTLARKTTLTGLPERRVVQDIGPEGGSLDLGAAGIFIEIPKGAVSEKTMFELVAHRSLHGFTVNMRPNTTLASRAKVQIRLDEGVEGDIILGHTNMVDDVSIVSELFRMRRDGNHAHGSVSHFSGYMVGCGRDATPCNPADGNPLCVWVDDES